MLLLHSFVAVLVTFLSTLTLLTNCGKKKKSPPKCEAAAANLAPTQADVAGGGGGTGSKGGSDSAVPSSSSAGRLSQKKAVVANAADGSKASSSSKGEPQFQKYPSIKAATKSMKQKRQAELEKDRKKKVETGFYQSKSDEDDTLEKVNSLNLEESAKSLKKGKSTISKKT